MTFEQPASLDRFVAEPLPVNWSSRWKFIRIFIPILVFITICMAERIGVMMWELDKFDPTKLGLALLMPLFILTSLLVTNEIKLRWAQGAGRFLNLMDKGISFQSGGRPLIRWSKVVAFWFEDIPGEAQFSKVTIEYLGDRKTRFPRRQLTVLDKRTQCPALLSELKVLLQQHGLSFRIESQKSPPVLLPARNPVLGMSLGLAGFLFLMHGVPLLLIPLIHDSNEPHQSDTNDRWSPKQKEKFGRFIKEHFSSKEQLDKVMFTTGGVLTSIGLALFVSGMVVQRPKKDGGPSGGDGVRF